jgi:pimeloyl-ACP methyl ester carboxylesterase
MARRKALGAARSDNTFGVFKDGETDWVFKRTLEMMSEKAAEIGECLHVARCIDENDGESWVREWAALAERVEAQGDESLAQGARISARESYLRASNYYRTAEYGCGPTHPRFHELWAKSVETFHKTCPLFDPPVQIVEVPFEGYRLPGYFWRPDNSGTPRPTIVCVGGSDSSGEEIFFVTGPGAVRRGYNYFTFEYPGHRGAVHLYPDCIKRPDYEVPFKAAFDFLETLPGVDERIALAGFSMGGYVVARVAIYEPRVRAVIPDSPILDLGEIMSTAFLPQVRRIPAPLRESVMSRAISRSPLKQSVLAYGLWTWGAAGMSLIEWMESGQAARLNIRDTFHRITCPALALVGEGEGAVMLRQAQEFYEGIASEVKRLHIFSLAADGSNDHCQLDNFARAHQVAFDWLNEVFEYQPELPFEVAALA